MLRRSNGVTRGSINGGVPPNIRPGPDRHSNLRSRVSTIAGKTAQSA
jgi:hypothetical protein